MIHKTLWDPNCTCRTSNSLHKPLSYVNRIQKPPVDFASICGALTVAAHPLPGSAHAVSILQRLVNGGRNFASAVSVHAVCIPQQLVKNARGSASAVSILHRIVNHCRGLVGAVSLPKRLVSACRNMYLCTKWVASALTMQSKAYTKRSNLRIELCLWIYTIYPLLQCQSSSGSVGKSIWPAFRRPRFKSWLDLNVFFHHRKDL